MNFKYYIYIIYLHLPTQYTCRPLRSKLFVYLNLCPSLVEIMPMQMYGQVHYIYDFKHFDQVDENVTTD